MLQRMNFVKNRDKIRSFIYAKWPRILPYLVTRGGMIIHIRHQNLFSEAFIQLFTRDL